MKKKAYKTIIENEEVDIDGIVENVIRNYKDIIKSESTIDEKEIKNFLYWHNYSDYTDEDIKYIYDKVSLSNIKDKLIKEDREHIKNQIYLSLDKLLNKSSMEYILDTKLLETEESYLNFVKHRIIEYLAL